MFLPTFNMAYFNTAVPILSRKPKDINVQNYPGLWLVKYQLGNNIIYSTFYTRLDQACVIWGWISVVIFAIAQFFPFNWGLQAILWSALSLIGTLAMVDLTGDSAQEEPFKFLLHLWVILMLGGLILTDLSIFLGWGEILLRLCPLWLGLNALGYLFTGVAMRSRTFLVTALVHLLGIFILPYVAQWQFLTTVDRRSLRGERLSGPAQPRGHPRRPPGGGLALAHPGRLAPRWLVHAPVGRPPAVPGERPQRRRGTGRPAGASGPRRRRRPRGTRSGHRRRRGRAGCGRTSGARVARARRG